MTNSYNAAARNKSPKNKGANRLPMNWYYFIIWFQLFITALSNVFQAYLYISGNFYANQGIDPAEFYQSYPLFRPLNIVFALALIAVGVFAVYTRFRLSGFRKGAPALLLKYNLVSVGVTMVYHILYAVISAVYGRVITGRELMDYISLFCIGMAYYLVNDKYFAKREFMFDR